MHLVVVIPTYNEADNIAALVDGLLALRPDLEVLVVDDASPDGTGAICARLAQETRRVTVLHRPFKLGLGSAYVLGLGQAVKMGAEFVFSMDADFSHHPRYIPIMLEAAMSADVVVGSRYVPGGAQAGCKPWRIILSRSANLFAKLMLRMQVADCTAGFRCYRRDVLEMLKLETLFSSGYSFMVETLYRCQMLDCRLLEVPITFENRRQGQSKISRTEIARALYTVLRLKWPRAPWEKLLLGHRALRRM